MAPHLRRCLRHPPPPRPSSLTRPRLPPGLHGPSTRLISSQVSGLGSCPPSGAPRTCCPSSGSVSSEASPTPPALPHWVAPAPRPSACLSQPLLSHPHFPPRPFDSLFLTPAVFPFPSGRCPQRLFLCHHWAAPTRPHSTSTCVGRSGRRQLYPDCEHLEEKTFL